MKMTPRVKLLLLAFLFALPMIASFSAYRFFPPAPTANYGELLLPPAALPADFRAPFGERWLLLSPGDAPCGPECKESQDAIARVRLALGRDASRVAIVQGDVATFAKAGVAVDPAHVYLADPHGNVMMRWPARPEMKRMLDDLKRLLKASQIG